MKKMIRSLVCAGLFMLTLPELTGCGGPPPAAPSAKKQIGEAEAAIDSGDSLAKRQLYDLAVTEYDKALSEIRKGESFATGTEFTRLSVLKDEAREKKIKNEFAASKKAGEASAHVKTPAPKENTVAAVDPDAARRAQVKAQENQRAESKKELDSVINAPKTAKKVDEPEDTGDVVAGKPKAVKPGTEGENEAPVVKAKPKDKNGIFADIDEKTPPLLVAKLQRIGKFVVAYCQVYNKSDDGKRITVYNFFKDRDNQIVIPQLTTAAFPYDHFSPKVKDLIADQSVRNLAPNSEEVLGHEFLQFVSVGECNNEEAAAKVAKLYLDVRLSDGTKLEAYSPESGAASMPVPKFNLPK